jgi:hypothetical protein
MHSWCQLRREKRTSRVQEVERRSMSFCSLYKSDKTSVMFSVFAREGVSQMTNIIYLVRCSTAYKVSEWKYSVTNYYLTSVFAREGVSQMTEGDLHKCESFIFSMIIDRSKRKQWNVLLGSKMRTLPERMHKDVWHHMRAITCLPFALLLQQFALE